MALPAGGEISMGQINSELGRSFTALIGLDEAENGVYATINTNSAFRPDPANPASMSEWYRYNHTAGPANQCTFSSATTVTPSLATVRGLLTVTGIPGTLALNVFGGAGSRHSTDAYFEVPPGTIYLAISAGGFQYATVTGPIAVQSTGYRLFAFFQGSAGNQATISCTQP